jgi:hypothetical protein
MQSVISKVMMKGLMVWASEVVSVLSAEYNLDSSKCMALIEQTWSTSVSAVKSKSKSKSVSSSVVKGKRLIPMPFNRETVDLNGCHGLNYNHGLFTQCRNIKLEEELYCNSCKTETETSSTGKPLCGTIEDRTDPDFKDSENRKPVHYLSVLRKLRVKPEAAMEEAGKQNITIDSFHLQELPKPVKQVKEKVVKEPKVKPVKVPKEKVVKEPKPVKEKPVKEVKVKPVKEKPVKEKVVKEKPVKEPKPVKEKVVKEKKESVGRPKSTKKPIETAAVEDLFASLVAEELSNASGNESEPEVQPKEVQPKRTEKEMKELFVSIFGEDDDEVSELSGSDSESKKTDKKEKQPKKTDKKAESESERKERAAMQNEEKEQKQREAAAAKEQKLKEAAAAKLEKEAAVAAAKLEKEAAVAAEKEKKALAEAEKKAKAAAEKEQKLKEAADAKEQKLKEAADAKEQKLKEAAEKKAKAAAESEKKAATKKQKEVVASEAPKKVEEPVVPVEVTKVTVKRITIDGKEYLKSSINMLYDPKTREEVGIYNTETGGIDALPEESDDEEEVEDDYDSEDN